MSVKYVNLSHSGPVGTGGMTVRLDHTVNGFQILTVSAFPCCPLCLYRCLMSINSTSIFHHEPRAESVLRLARRQTILGCGAQQCGCCALSKRLKGPLAILGNKGLFFMEK